MNLHITNGRAYTNHLNKIINEEIYSFNECMMSGTTINNIFCEEFIKIRSTELKVNKEYYVNNIKDIISLRNNVNDFSKITLYFGLDTFCQINLLTLLCYLEEINYKNKLILNIIDDYSFKTIESNIEIKLGFYKSMYTNILINKVMPIDNKIINKKAIDLYFDFMSNDGKLANMVKQNKHLSEEELIVLLLNNSKEYGLSDLQAKDLIKKYK